MTLKTDNRASRAGFTLVEILLACAIMIVASVMAVYGWIYVMRGERTNSIQAELDMNVRMAIERIRSEIRLSAIDRIVYYPDGSGPYVALSFPMAFNRDNQGLTTMLSDTNILWDTTVIYHVDPVSTNRLLRTTFAPRDNAMDPARRRQQLQGVVAQGSGKGLEGQGEVAATRVIFANFFTWNISAIAGVFDAYSATPGKRRLNFGALPLGPGEHHLTFTALDRNPASRGYKLGIDTLKVSAGACELEAEDLDLIDCSPVPANQPGFTFSGKCALVSDPGDGADVDLTLVVPNDRWTESNFRSYGVGSEDVEIAMDEAADDEVVRINGGGVVWQAAEQTGSSNTLVYSDLAGSRAYRVLLQGSTQGWIRKHGRLMPHTAPPYSSGVRMRLPVGTLVDTTATIGLAEPAATSALDVRPGTLRHLNLVADTVNGDALWVLAGSLPMDISPTNNYVVSFWVWWGGTISLWNDTRAAGGSMAAVRTNCLPSVLGEYSWPAAGGVRLLNSVPYVQSVATVFPAQGVFVSEIYDTTLESPDVTRTRWRAFVPDGTRLGVQYRAGGNAGLADAPAWDSCSIQTDPDGRDMNGSGRYVQFRAILESDRTGLLTPSLRNAGVDWAGALRILDLGGQIVVGPDFGAFQLKVDDLPLIKGLRFDLALFKQLPGGGAMPPLTSSMSMEIEPRNSGR